MLVRIEPGIECDTGDDDELVGEIELIAVAAKPSQRGGPAQTALAAQRYRSHHKADGERKQRIVCAAAAEGLQQRPAGPDGDQQNAGPACNLRYTEPRRSHGAMGEPVDEERREAAERDAGHAGKIRVLCLQIVLCPHNASEGTEREQGEGECDPGPAAYASTAKENEADERKEEVERLFDRERPEHGPAGWKVGVARGFEPVEMERECGEESARKREDFLVDDVAVDVQKMQQTQDGEHEQQQGHDARETDAVEGARPDGVERTEAAQRGERDEEAGDSEEG